MPLLVDSASKGAAADLLPTLFALWRAPGLLRAITLKHAHVAGFLLGAPSACGTRARQRGAQRVPPSACARALFAFRSAVALTSAVLLTQAART